MLYKQKVQKTICDTDTEAVSLQLILRDACQALITFRGHWRAEKKGKKNHSKTHKTMFVCGFTWLHVLSATATGSAGKKKSRQNLIYAPYVYFGSCLLSLKCHLATEIQENTLSFVDCLFYHALKMILKKIVSVFISKLRFISLKRWINATSTMACSCIFVRIKDFVLLLHLNQIKLCIKFEKNEVKKWIWCMYRYFFQQTYNTQSVCGSMVECLCCFSHRLERSCAPHLSRTARQTGQAKQDNKSTASTFWKSPYSL